MFQCSICNRTTWRRKLQRRAQLVCFLVLVAGDLVVEGQDNLTVVGNEVAQANPPRLVTNVVQFGTLSRNDYLEDCAFHLRGVITLVDTNRNLVVLQDETGAIAVNFDMQNSSLQVGQLVSLMAPRCHPYVVSFPDYPFRPSGWDIRKSFEAPVDWGEYYLTRMRAYLRPPVTGEYTFWIASDNSSELWLSPNERPSAARRIANIPPYGWVSPHEWAKYPSQRSEAVTLEAGRTYYIEAIQEQTTVGDNLSVAWQGPRRKQAVIGERYLSPWTRPGDPNSLAGANGVLREYWTNYSVGNLSVLTGPLTYESALSAEEVSATIHGEGMLPEAKPIALDERMAAGDNYRWVQVEGRVSFAATEGEIACLELSEGRAHVQVRALCWERQLWQHIHTATLRVEGVSEGRYDQQGNLVAGLIWVTTTNGIAVSETPETNSILATAGEAVKATLTNANPALQGFFSSQGVVTFNDRVFGQDHIYVQEGDSVLMVTLRDRRYENVLEVGQLVGLGGQLQARKHVPVLRPLVVTRRGWRAPPPPLTDPVEFPVPPSSEGKWTEFEGVVHSVNPNGTLSLMAKGGFVSLWLARTPSNELSYYVDSKVRVRGVLSSALPDAPLLLVPSRSFVDMEQEPPPVPFAVPARSVADLFSNVIEPSTAHRVRLVGAITYRNRQSFFIEDQSGGIGVQALDELNMNVGDAVEVIGFPAIGEPAPTISEAMVRSADTNYSLEPKRLDLVQAASFTQLGRLIHVSATLLSQKTSGRHQVLELQEQQRVFEATLANEEGNLPPIEPGSRLKIVGVCDYETVTSPVAGRNGMEKSSTGPLNIRLRRPSDVVVLRGPPWWTWKRAVASVGALFMVLMVSLLWVHLLRRRLERQQATQRAFSQQILERLEGERRRIAANLHDGLGQVLLAIKNQALLAIQRAPDESGLRQRLDEITGATSQAIEEVRQITHGLRPYQLGRLGLTQAIRATVNRASASSPIVFASRVEDIDNIFDKDSEIHVYRIVQEAVNNVAKHSNATEAAVVIKMRADIISLSIRDNGKGFDAGLTPSAYPHDLGYGLSGIAERVRILGGSLIINSRLGEGASLTVEVPLPARKHDKRRDNSDRG